MLVLKKQIFVVNIGPETVTKQLALLDKNNLFYCYILMSTQCVLVLKRQIFVVNIGPETVTKQLALFDKNNLFAVIF